MNVQIKKLYRLAEAPSRRILGLMSGTSLDGLDMALCKISGAGYETKVEIENYATQNYQKKFRENIGKVFSKEEVILKDICLLNEWVGLEHARIINDQLKIWGIKNALVDLIASHGQTIYHAPKKFHQNKDFPNGTLQIGDGDHIAQNTKIITFHDFRQKQLAAGGEGAPLAPYGESLLFSNVFCHRVLINLGGIANFTYLPSLQSNKTGISGDLGPANTLMDALVRKEFSSPGNEHRYDPNGDFARNGKVNDLLLGHLLSDPFFKEPIPKSTGPEKFSLGWFYQAVNSIKNKSTKKHFSVETPTNEIDSNLAAGETSISKEDLLATLNEFTASLIFQGIKPYLFDPLEIYLSGGGIYNRTLMENLQKKLSPNLLNLTDKLGIPPDAKEAVLFAVLANEALAGNAESYRMDKNQFPNVSMGKISLPN